MDGLRRRVHTLCAAVKPTPHASLRVPLVRALSLAALFVASHGLAACATDRGARIRYMHPSPLSRWGNRIRVEPFENEGSSGVSRMIEQRVRQSGAFQMVGEGAQMAIVGEVHDNGASPEQVTSRPFTCTRQVPEQRTRQVPVVIPGLQPRVELRTEQYTEMVPQPYACTQLVRSTEARFSMRVRINARTRPIHVVFDRRFDLNDRQETLGLAGSDGQDQPPPPVDGDGLLRSLHERAAQRFAQEALPTVDAAEVTFADCGDPRCEQGLALVRSNDLAGAERLFGEAAGQLSRATDPTSRRRLAAALYNRGLVRGYTNQLAEGIDDLRLAIAGDATQTAWQQQLMALQDLQTEIEAARFRGETPGGGNTSPTPSGAPARGRGRGR